MFLYLIVEFCDILLYLIVEFCDMFLYLIVEFCDILLYLIVEFCNSFLHFIMMFSGVYILLQCFLDLLMFCFLQRLSRDSQRWGEICRMKLQYNEARKQVSDLQQQLASIEDRIRPEQIECDRDRFVQCDRNRFVQCDRDRFVQYDYDRFAQCD